MNRDDSMMSVEWIIIQVRQRYKEGMNRGKRRMLAKYDEI